MTHITFRPLTKADFPQFARWLGRPHVQKWWPEPATVEHVAKEYGGCTDGDFMTRVYVVCDGAKPIGILQAFELKSYPDWAQRLGGPPDAVSIDYLIGEESYIGRGVGAQMIRQFVETVVPEVYPNASAVVTSAELENGASLGALAKAGFEPGDIITGEHGTPERVMTRQL
jgi:aminoglycoside 6'-N-acetyltransferase